MEKSKISLQTLNFAGLKILYLIKNINNFLNLYLY